MTETETEFEVEEEIRGVTFHISTGSRDKGRVKHIHEDRDPESICGMGYVQKNLDGKGNLNALHTFKGLDMYPEERWCSACFNKFKYRYRKS